MQENDVGKFAEAIIRLLDNPMKREEMGKAGRRRIDERLNWDKQKDKLKAAYDYLFGAG